MNKNISYLCLKPGNQNPMNNRFSGFKSFTGKFDLITKMYLTMIVPISHSTSLIFFSNSSKFTLNYFNYILKE